MYGEKTGCDFFGYDCSARAIMVECKMREKTSLGIGPKSDIKPHQWNELMFCHNAGGVALIVWQRGEEVAVFDMDIAQRLSIAEDRVSIPWKQIPKLYKHHESEKYRLLDPYLVIPLGQLSSRG